MSFSFTPHPVEPISPMPQPALDRRDPPPPPPTFPNVDPNLNTDGKFPWNKILNNLDTQATQRNTPSKISLSVLRLVSELLIRNRGQKLSPDQCKKILDIGLNKK